MFLYFYRAVSGRLIPATTKKELAQLKADFENSVTPLYKILAVNKRSEALKLIATLEAWLACTPTRERGLCQSLRTCIEELQGTP